MFEILNNPWAVGIGGGILSGLAVTLITRVFLEKKDDRDLLERATAANKELIYAIRPCIAEGSIPSLVVIESLVAATARKYQLSAEKLSTSRQLIDDLIKEVMDSSFISASTKSEYCMKLNKIFDSSSGVSNFPPANMSHVIPEAFFSKARGLDRELGYKEYRQKLFSAVSLMMGFMAAVMTAVFAFMDTFKERSILIEPLMVLLPVLVAVVVAMFSALVARFISKVTNSPEELRSETEMISAAKIES